MLIKDYIEKMKIFNTNKIKSDICNIDNHNKKILKLLLKL